MWLRIFLLWTFLKHTGHWFSKYIFFEQYFFWCCVLMCLFRCEDVIGFEQWKQAIFGFVLAIMSQIKYLYKNCWYGFKNKAYSKTVNLLWTLQIIDSKMEIYLPQTSQRFFQLFQKEGAEVFHWSQNSNLSNDNSKS